MIDGFLIKKTESLAFVFIWVNGLRKIRIKENIDRRIRYEFGRSSVCVFGRVHYLAPGTAKSQFVRQPQETACRLSWQFLKSEKSQSQNRDAKYQAIGNYLNQNLISISSVDNRLIMCQ